MLNAYDEVVAHAIQPAHYDLKSALDVRLRLSFGAKRLLIAVLEQVE